MSPDPEQSTTDPLAATVADRQGQRFRVRPLQTRDAASFGLFLDGLTAATRGVYGPHPLNADHARILCDEINPRQCLRFIALGPIPENPDQVAAYMILDLGVRDSDAGRYAEVGVSLDPVTTATFAPVVGDAWQEHGLGSAMIRVVIDAARQAGRTQIILMGGVRDDNPRARHFYEKAGFKRVRGFFAGGVDNHDMILQL